MKTHNMKYFKNAWLTESIDPSQASRKHFFGSSETENLKIS